ncbi:MAG TPA: class I SAM-dependent methyltransferase [Steroidobacteraceae bacterium]|nr:class I SAM-dependent methyltransferase [Steroidobacteraceae bacterium]
MATSETHYATHLGPVYSWMLGDLDAAFARGAAEIDELPLSAARGVAVDLGAGLGLHALSLAKLGFEVVAIDNCPVLLDELQSRGASLPIAVHNADLLEFRLFLVKQAQVIVCMGDTLTHLSALSAVDSLLAAVAASLPRGGVFAATFRDYATSELKAEQRFILVRADERRILTCFLEYQDARVLVHDLLHERENGRWRQVISSYPKLRLAPAWVISNLSELGFSVKRDTTPSGMVRIVAIKN